MSDILSPRLRKLQQQVAADDRALAHFWLEIEQHGTPIIEPAGDGQVQVTFLWRDDGSTRSVDVIQDWGADGIREHQMAKLANSDVWYLTRTLPADTRTTYQLAPEPLPPVFSGGVPFIPDPLNPRRHVAYSDESGFTIWFSLLALPDAPPQPWRDSEVPAGSVSVHTPFPDARRIWVYTPATMPDEPCSLLIAFDGQSMRHDLPKMLDLHIAQGRILPTIALMIDNPDRRELMCVPEYADYVGKQVIPWARANFPVAPEIGRTVISGTSYGGLCAAYTALRFPSIFGAVLSQTGWYRWHPDHETEHLWLARQYIASEKLPLRFYLDVGKLETARMSDHGPSQLAANRHMRDVLRAKGYEVHYRETSGGHDSSSTETPLFEALPLLL